MRRTLALLVAAALLAAPLAAGADTITLTNGKTVTGTIPIREPHRRALTAAKGTVYYKKDSVQIQTDGGLREFKSDEVKHFVVDCTGPDGKAMHVTVRFPPAPIKMPFELATKHYVIKTDTAPFVCKNAGRAMEQLYDAYTKIFRPDDKDARPKAEVVIFDKETDFLRYAKSLNMAVRKGHLGFFRSSPFGGDIIAAYKRRTDEFYTLSTLYHEATHQFITMVMGRTNRPPLWVNEGLAVYFETSQMRNGRLKTGLIPRARLALLQKQLRSGKYVPLADLVKRGHADYDALCYSEGWSLAYFFLRAKGGAYRTRFSKYFAALKNGEDHDKAFQASLANDIAQLERAWKRFVLGLKLPRE